MSKIEIKDLYLVFGNEKQKALKMLKEGKTKSEILKATGCTVAVKKSEWGKGIGRKLLETVIAFAKDEAGAFVVHIRVNI